MALIFKGKLQKNNTVTIPKAVQNALGLRQGDTIQFEVTAMASGTKVTICKQDKEVDA